MLLLCLDTSTPTAVIALVEGDRVLAERRLPAHGKPGETLLPEMSALLEGAGLALADVALFVVGVGPGSFTGVRVALSTAKGFALGRALPVVGVSTLDAIAMTASEAGVVVALIDAHKDRVYAAVYRDGAVVSEPVDTSAADLVAALSRDVADDATLTFVGNGLGRYGDVFRHAFGARATFCAEELGVPSGLALASLGRRKWEASGPSDALSLEPTYVRPSDATLPVLLKAPFLP